MRVKNRRRVRHKKNVRVTRRKKKNWFAPFGILFTLGAVILTYRWFDSIRLPALSTIRDVRVLGANALSPPDLVKLSGLAKGAALSDKTSRSAIEKLRAHPRLSQVSIIKDVTGDIVIRVKEREPVALMQLDRLHYLDGEGRILDQADARAALPIVTGDWKPREEKEMATQAMELRRTLVEEGFEEKEISELHYDPRAGWTLYPTAFKVPVVFGVDRFGEKAGRMMRLMDRFRGRQDALEEIDLDYEKRAVIKLKTEVP